MRHKGKTGGGFRVLPFPTALWKLSTQEIPIAPRPWAERGAGLGLPRTGDALVAVSAPPLGCPGPCSLGLGFPVKDADGMREAGKPSRPSAASV